MSEISDLLARFSKLQADYPDLVKTMSDGSKLAGILVPAASGGIFGVLAALANSIPTITQFVADIEKDIADIKALGVSEAVAAGTHVAVTPTTGG